MVTASAVLHAVWSASIKSSASPLAFNLRQKAFFLLGLALVAPFVPWAHVPRGVFELLALTGVAHGLYFYFMSRALERADLTVAYPIIRSTPAVLPFLAVPLLGERISPAGGLGIAIVVAGVWLVHTRGDLRPRALLGQGTGFAYLTLLTTVAYSLVDKEAMAIFGDAPWPGPVPRSITYFFLTTAANAVVFTPLAVRDLPRGTWRETFRGEWGRAALAVAVSLGSYGLILEAYRSAPASYVVAVRQTSVLFAVVIASTVLRERPGRARTLGAAATVAGVALIALFP